MKDFLQIARQWVIYHGHYHGHQEHRTQVICPRKKYVRLLPLPEEYKHQTQPPEKDKVMLNTSQNEAHPHPPEKDTSDRANISLVFVLVHRFRTHRASL